MPRTILVIDDNDAIRTLVKRFLTDNGLAVILTDNGSEGLLLAREARPDLILVDAQMPGLDGPAMCRVLRKERGGRTPIIIMSGARMDDKDVLSGLESGADDYVLKPFSLPVLLARMKAVLRRRPQPGPGAERIRKFGIELDPAGRTAKAEGRPLSLTRKEFDLLAELTGAAGRVLSVPFLLETVWGYDPADYNDPGTVEVHVSRLRSKLGPRLAKRIVKVIGLGYKFETEPS